MQKVSYVASGETTTFYFNFPYFESDNIVVTVNNGPAPSYNLIGIRYGTDPDFPFVSGKIVFKKPPKHFDTITIERHLPLVRPVDYQPLANITSTMLNQDMNYTMELLKDIRDELDTFKTNYADIVNKESTELLLSKIDLVNQNIADISEHMDVLDSIPIMQATIESLQSTVNTLTSRLSSCTNSIDSLNTRTIGIVDYVVESQEPNVTNNYTWYRKYKSGWIEQGGQVAMSSTNGMDVAMPVQMADNNYSVFTHIMDDNQTGYVFEVQIKNKTTTSFNSRMIASYQSGTWVSGYNFTWRVFGRYSA